MEVSDFGINQGSVISKSGGCGGQVYLLVDAFWLVLSNYKVNESALPEEIEK